MYGLSQPKDDLDASPAGFEDACNLIASARASAKAVLAMLDQLDHHVCYDNHSKTFGYLQDACDELAEAREELLKVDAIVTAWAHAEREPDPDAHDPGY